MKISAQKKLRAILSCCVLLCIGLQVNAAELSGRVLDVYGLPVANAQLHSNKGLFIQAFSDENGRFTLKDLPSGFVTVVALHPEEGVGFIRPLSGGSDVVITLRPFNPPLVQDRQRAEKILSELASWAAGDEILDYRGHWAILAPFDLKRAEELSCQADGSLPETFILSVMTLLARDDPKAAVEWGMPRLDDIESPMLRNMAMINLGQRIADSNPTLANELYERATLLPDLPEDEEVSMSGGFAFELALRLKRPEVPGLIENMLKEAKTEDAEAEEDDEEWKAYSAQGRLVGTVAKYDFALAEQLFEGLEPPHQPQALSWMIGVLLNDGNLPKAQAFLDKLSGIDTEEAKKLFSEAGIKVLLVQGKTDPAGALQLAQRITQPDYRPEALAAAAQFQGEAKRLTLLKDAVIAARQHRLPLLQLANIALAAGEKFPELKLELTKEVVQLWKDAPEQQRDAYIQESIEDVVTLIAAFDPLTARTLLEVEWARIHPEAFENSKVDLLGWMAFSMAKLDFERALEMTRSIPQGEMGFHFARYRTEHGLARRLLIGPEKWQGGNGYEWNRP